MSILGIIPARYASTRFPGKPLADIKGKSMLRRVYEQASGARTLDDLIIATDDERISDHAGSFGARVVMTSGKHPSGTDRCFEAYMNHEKKFDYVLNVQGDEPFLDPRQIDSLTAICDGQTEIATQMTRCTSHETLFDSGEVKIVLGAQDRALYFSRSVIPFLKDHDPKKWHQIHSYYRHVGMYAYRTDVLAQICQLPVSSLEKAESLEQLRWLENGFSIRCSETNFDSHCIDSPGDIEKVLRLMNIV